MIDNKKIFATEVGTYACSQGLFGSDEVVEQVGDFQLGDCNDGHEDPDLDKAEESEEGIIGAAALGVAKVGGALCAGIFKACGWMVGAIAGCPWIMIVIFVVLAVSGLIAFAIKKSNEAEDDGEVKKARLLDKLKSISSDKTVKAEFEKMCHENYNAYAASIENINKRKPEIEKNLASFKAGEIKVKFWKEDKFNNQLKKNMLNMMKADKGSKNLDFYPLLSSSYVQVVINKPNPKDPKFCEYLESLAKNLSTKSLTLKVNKDKTGLVSESFNLKFGEGLVNSIKRLGK